MTCLERVLCEFRPLHAIFSTPNYEANTAIRAAVAEDAVGVLVAKSVGVVDGDGTADGSSIGDQPSPSLCSHPSLSPTINHTKEELFREKDHKFEFTRLEFRNWAEAGLLAADGRYEVQFAEVGCKLPGMNDGETSDVGGATQFAIFRRQDHNTASSNEVEELAKTQTMAKEKESVLYWEWSSGSHCEELLTK